MVTEARCRGLSRGAPTSPAVAELSAEQRFLAKPELAAYAGARSPLPELGNRSVRSDRAPEPHRATVRRNRAIHTRANANPALRATLIRPLGAVVA